MEKSSKLEYFIVGFLLLAIVTTGALWLLRNRDQKIKDLNNNNSSEKEEKKEPEVPIKNNYDLNFDFLKFDYNKNNIVYSPLSIRKGLGLLKEGAMGDTYNQLDAVLNKFDDYNVTNVDKKIGISNALFIKNSYKDIVKEEFVNNLTNKYKADLFYDELTSPDIVNNYVKEKTFGMIPKLFDSVDGSKLVLVNALAIDLNWVYKFDESNTYDRTYYLDKEINIPFISDSFKHVDNIKYYNGNDLKIVSMPLESVGGTNLEYIAIMPNDIDSFVKDVNYSYLKDNFDKLKSGKDVILNISMPKYKFDYELKFDRDLLNLGLTDMFDKEKANFYKIADTGLYVDQAKHKAHIEVSEEGVKAAAATGFAMKDSAIMLEEKPVVINFNKPHLVIIRDKDTEDSWFVTLVYNPLGD